jgi:DNA-binding IclR family transcriptional regulator
MAQQIARHDPVLDRVHDTMSELRDATGETIVIGKLHEGRPWSIWMCWNRHMRSAISLRQASGASFMPTRSARPCWRRWTTPSAALLPQLPFQAFTPRTLTTPAALEADLRRARGAYVNLSESMPDVGALAWPVRLSGECYAISIAGPVYRIEPHLERYAAMLRAACASLEKT